MEICIAKFDETEHWTDPELRRIAGSIFTVYLYNPKLVVHCCELTPSRELDFVGFVISGTSEFRELSEERREAIYDQLREACRDAPSVIYVHARDIDKLPTLERSTDIAPGSVSLGDFDGGEYRGSDAHPDDWTQEQMDAALEAARESIMGNGYVDT